IKAALANPVLKPHFAIIEAKRLLMGRPFGANQKDPQTTEDYIRLIDDATVMSFDEIERICDMHWNANQLSFLQFGPNELTPVCKVFRQRVERFRADGSIEARRASVVLTRLDKNLANP